MNEIERAFLLPTKVLDWTNARARALQSNLAHANESGWKRVDVDFEELMQAVRKSRDGDKEALAKAHPSIEEDRNAPPPSADGKSIQFEKEQVQIDKNALLQELAVFVMNGKLNSLRNAIRGTAS